MTQFTSYKPHSWCWFCFYNGRIQKKKKKKRRNL